MTTKSKIMLGFVIVVLLSLTNVVVGYRNTAESVDSFENYMLLTKLTNTIASLQENIQNTSILAFAFLTTRDERLLAQSMEQLNALPAQFDITIDMARIPENKKDLQDLKIELGEYKTFLEVIGEDMHELASLYANGVEKEYDKMTDALGKMSEIHVAYGNITGLESLSNAFRAMTANHSALSRFAYAVTEENAEIAFVTLAKVEESLKNIENFLLTYEGQTSHANTMEVFKALESTVEDMRNYGDELMASIDGASTTRDILINGMRTVNRRSAEAMTNFEQQLLATLKTAQQVMLTLGIVGTILAVLIAVYIISGIARTLNKLAKFSDAIAHGDFEYHVDIKEKGEVGIMVTAMQQIPETLRNVLREYKDFENHIQSGRIDAVADAQKFQGDFSSLIQASNSISQKFTTIIDSIPSPVVILDKNSTAQFLNAEARNYVGNDYKGKRSNELFARDDDGTPTDGMLKVHQQKVAGSGETVARPGGKRMDISYQAIPMLDSNGDITAVLQLITDLTDIKSTQRRILDAAKQAEGISNRVAASAEQLSAQLDTVSRGAELQRSRVESTASAMTEMNATVLEVATNASEASAQSENTRSKAAIGAEIVNKVVAAITVSNNVSTAMQNNMQELGVQAEGIGGVMNVISDIADQTNLLALNAAIEAARAGDAGRGFAVVADEVRKLAEKTMDATHEVGTNIRAIQQSAKSNIEEMDVAVKSVMEAATLAQSSGTALEEILTLASTNSEIVTSIATAAEEQSATSEEINRAIEEISHVVVETSDGVAQSSDAVRDLSHMAQELRKIMEQLLAR